jgi:hypothetical protein
MQAVDLSRELVVLTGSAQQPTAVSDDLAGAGKRADDVQQCAAWRFM